MAGLQKVRKESILANQPAPAAPRQDRGCGFVRGGRGAKAPLYPCSLDKVTLESL
jgi:hypothetical protein